MIGSTPVGRLENSGGIVCFIGKEGAHAHNFRIYFQCVIKCTQFVHTRDGGFHNKFMNMCDMVGVYEVEEQVC